jgi:cysteine desulfuration protein SufE
MSIMAEYPKKLQDLIETISIVSDDSDRVSLLIDYANKLEKVPKEVAQEPYPEESKVPFCESGVYVWSVKNSDGTLKYYFDVDNPQGVSARALSSILEKTISGEKPENIEMISEDIVEKLFGSNLSTRKNMGLLGIVQKVKREAKKYMN